MNRPMSILEIVAFNRGVRAVAALAEQVGGLIETEVTAAGACDADSAAMMRRALGEFAQQATVLLLPEGRDPIDAAAEEE